MDSLNVPKPPAVPSPLDQILGVDGSLADPIGAFRGAPNSGSKGGPSVPPSES